jgi:predicted deacetylase
MSEKEIFTELGFLIKMLFAPRYEISIEFVFVFSTSFNVLDCNI